MLALYRFAFLLQGGEDAARRTLLAMLSECAPRLAQLRTDRSRLALALRKLREQCLKNGVPAVTEGAPAEVAPGFPALFCALPEPGRSALALVYLKAFSPGDSAALLDLSLDDFSVALRKARSLLQESLSASEGSSNLP